MTRLPDPTIPGDEELFRGAKPEEVDGDRLRPSAVDLQGMSCNRRKYAPPESVLTLERTYVVRVTPEQLPGPFLLSNGVEWEFFAQDRPEPANEAHAEIRARRVVNRPALAADRPKSQGARHELKARLAEKMRVVIKP